MIDVVSTMYEVFFFSASVDFTSDNDFLATDTVYELQAGSTRAVRPWSVPDN